MKFVRALANSSTEALEVGGAGEAVLVAVEVLVGVAVSVQATPTNAIAAHVNTSEISFIYKFPRFGFESQSNTNHRRTSERVSSPVAIGHQTGQNNFASPNLQGQSFYLR